MKKIFFTLAFLCALLFWSCETEDDNLTKEQNIELNHKVSKETLIMTSRPGDDLSGAALFEGRLQWVSFITAKALMNNSLNTQEINDLMLPNNTIPLNALLGSTEHFKDDFYNILLHFVVHGGIRGEEEPSTPPRPAIPTCCISHEGITQIILDYLLIENCIELYFPNGTITNNEALDYSITSTAHPLTNVMSNYGFDRFKTPIQTGNGNENVQLTIVNPLTVGNNNIIVARPKRETLNWNCTYSEYETIDFTLFLD